MKLVIAIIQPSKLNDVKEELSNVEVFRMTVTESKGFGQQKGQKEIYRGIEYELNFIDKIRLDIAVNDQFLQPTIDAIIRGAKSGPEGKIGDGKIIVLPIENVIRIRTGEQGGGAI
jgi:nitrogen regulatory protein PII